MAYTPEINGYKIPVGHLLPLDESINALDKDSKRATSGRMIRFWIGDKRALVFDFRFLPIQEAKRILKEVKGKSCNITYEDSELGLITKRFYINKRQSKRTPDGEIYEYIKFNAVEV